MNTVSRFFLPSIDPVRQSRPHSNFSFGMRGDRHVSRGMEDMTSGADGASPSWNALIALLIRAMGRGAPLKFYNVPPCSINRILIEGRVRSKSFVLHKASYKLRRIRGSYDRILRLPYVSKSQIT